MTRFLIIVTFVLAATAASPGAQHQHQTGGAAGASTIKALTPEQEEQYRQGDGMGVAKAAELNHYPGPKHALELASDLSVSDTQASRLRDIQTRMQLGAKRLGLVILEKEATLDHLFAERRATADGVKALAIEIGELQGQLRAMHLGAHIATVEVLSADQIMRYDTLRGNAVR